MKRQLDYRLAWLILCLTALTACQSANPIRAAETSEQRAYAAYGTFVIFQEMAADLVEQPSIPRNAKLAIVKAEERAKPVADSLLEAYVEFISVKAEFQAGNTSQDKLITASTRLDDWVTRLAPLVNELLRTIKGAE